MCMNVCLSEKVQTWKVLDWMNLKVLDWMNLKVLDWTVTGLT